MIDEDKTVIDMAPPPNSFKPSPSPSAPQAVQVRYLEGLYVLKDDPNRINNILMGTLFFLIPVVGILALYGWFCEIMQRKLQQHPQPIPRIDFADFTFYLGRGVAPFLVSLVASLVLIPFIFILQFCGIFLLQAVAKNGFGVVAIAVSAVMGLILFIVYTAFILGVSGPVTFAQISEDFSKSLKVGPALDYLKKTWAKQLMGLLVLFLVSIPFSIIGLLLCGVGIYPVCFILAFNYFYLSYQLYLYYLSRGGQPVEVKALRSLPSELKRQVMPG